RASSWTTGWTSLTLSGPGPRARDGHIATEGTSEQSSEQRRSGRTHLPRRRCGRGPGEPEPGGAVRGGRAAPHRPVRAAARPVLAPAAAASRREDADLLAEGPGLPGRPAAPADLPELPGHHRPAVRAAQLAVRRDPAAGVREVPVLGERAAGERALQ